MALSIAIVKQYEETYLMLGGWDTKEEAQESLGSGSDEFVVCLEKYEGSHNSPNDEIFEAILLSAGNEFSLGRDLEEFAKFCFQLGRKIER